MSAFEVFSAFGTVGLSMNLTLNYNWKSDYYFYDVFGKMGLTLAFSFARKRTEK